MYFSFSNLFYITILFSFHFLAFSQGFNIDFSPRFSLLYCPLFIKFSFLSKTLFDKNVYFLFLYLFLISNFQNTKKHRKKIKIAFLSLATFVSKIFSYQILIIYFLYYILKPNSKNTYGQFCYFKC